MTLDSIRRLIPRDVRGSTMRPVLYAGPCGDFTVTPYGKVTGSQIMISTGAPTHHRPSCGRCGYSWEWHAIQYLLGEAERFRDGWIALAQEQVREP
jgi:hypothetical protein